MVGFESILVEVVLLEAQSAHRARPAGELGPSAVTTEVPLRVQLDQLVPFMAGEGAREAHSRTRVSRRTAGETSVEGLPAHVSPRVSALVVVGASEHGVGVLFGGGLLLQHVHHRHGGLVQVGALARRRHFVNDERFFSHRPDAVLSNGRFWRQSSIGFSPRFLIRLFNAKFPFRC